jgi:hypothetical protein
MFPTAEGTQTEHKEKDDFDMPGDGAISPGQDKVLAQLRGMSLSERDEVIDTLISQENF